MPDAVLRLGCGFAEIGTVTPLPQQGNPTPARIPADRATAPSSTGSASTTAAMPRRWPGCSARGRRGVVGVNIGANKDATDRVADYVRGLETFYDVASYFTINISSPNTPGLRDLQDPAALEELLARLLAARAKQIDGRASRSGRSSSSWRPTSPRTTSAPSSCSLPRTGVDGIAVSNTTLVAPRAERRQRAPSRRRPVGAAAVPSLDGDARARHQATAGAFR